MKIGYMQFAPRLGEVDRNIKQIENLLPDAAEADLLVLPELCNTGYRFETRDQAVGLAESISGARFVDFLTEKARQYSLHLVAGMAERENDKLYNSSVLVGPDGLVGTYRKLHLFMDEKDIFEPGNVGLPVFDIGSCKVGMLICFDWIFPEVWRILALKGADIICHPSNLVIPGLCQKSIPTHAVCNRVYVVTANRFGTERDLTFTGLSTIADPKAEVLIQASPEADAVNLVEIDLALARDKKVTSRNDVLEDRRSAEYSELL